VALIGITLTDFRNYGFVDLDVAARPVVLTGPNGAGKTNLLEAISLLAPGRGLRGAPLAECARQGGAGGWAVAARVSGPLGPVRLGTGLVGEAGEARQCRVDGVRVAGPGAFADHVRVVWLTPALDRLWAGPASERRRFLDRLVVGCDPDHAARLGAFDKAMRERNRLLAEGRHEPAWLDALEDRMAAEGVAVAAARIELVARLTATIDDRPGASRFPPARLEMTGTLEAALAGASAIEAEDTYRAELAAGRRRDQAAGRTLQGPHRSDLAARHGITGQEAERCSTGEQKALLIFITLAHARLVADGFAGCGPLVLLDEVAAHLDAARRDALFEELVALGAQAWLTGTDSALFYGLSGTAQLLSVEAGQFGAGRGPPGP
jgi:DNA replication and repair protein RecF